jgi:hypothetical protein
MFVSRRYPMDEKCSACGSGRTEAAQLEGMAVRMDRTSTLKKVFNTGGAVRCRVCLDCGAITSLKADPEGLAEMLK